MSFVDELHEAEIKVKEEAEKKAEAERLAAEKRAKRGLSDHDYHFLYKIINYAKDNCRKIVEKGAEKRLNGFFTGYSFRTDTIKSLVPLKYSTEHYSNGSDPSGTRWCDAFNIDDPTAFEKMLNSKLAELGFTSHSSHCTLIRRENIESEGAGFWSNKRKFKPTGTVSYTIWIDISW